jgi:hypothetical protein
MGKILKLAEKLAEVESRSECINSLSKEEIFAVIGNPGFLTMKETGAVIDLQSYVTKINEDLTVFEDELFVNHVEMAVRLSDDSIQLRLNEISKEVLLSEGRKRKMSIKMNKALKLERDSLIASRWIIVRTVGLSGMAKGLGVDEQGFDMFASKLYQLICTTVYSASIDLAEERGAYKNWNIGLLETKEDLKNILNLEANELVDEPLLYKVRTSGIRNTIHLLIQ